MGVTEQMALAIEKYAKEINKPYSEMEKHILRCEGCWITPLDKNGVKTNSINTVTNLIGVTFCQLHAKEYESKTGKSPTCYCCSKPALEI